MRDPRQFEESSELQPDQMIRPGLRERHQHVELPLGCDAATRAHRSLNPYPFFVRHQLEGWNQTPEGAEGEAFFERWDCYQRDPACLEPRRQRRVLIVPVGARTEADDR